MERCTWTERPESIWQKSVKIADFALNKESRGDIRRKRRMEKNGRNYEL